VGWCEACWMSDERPTRKAFSSCFHLLNMKPILEARCGSFKYSK
jgi:hypothetical protein